MHGVVVVVGSIILDTTLAGPQPNPAQWSSTDSTLELD